MNLDKEDGELEETQKEKTESNDMIEYTKRVPSSQWACRQVDNYEKVDQVGEGTFGKVYKAKLKNSTKNNTYVALKRILMENEKEGFPITAIREIMILKRLNHKNIIKLLEIVTSKPSEKNKFRGNVYLVFEYMEHDLSGLADLKLSFNVPMIKCILHQIITGVQYLHSQNIIHRDIKGANILINNKGEVKIADFGLARIHNPHPSLIKQYTNRVVTLWYRSPELLFGSTNYGPSIDMWSVGCLFSELLTGVPPFRGNKEPEQVKLICEKLGVPTEETWPGVTNLKGFSAMTQGLRGTNVLKSYYLECKKCDDVAFDLLSKMLQLDPNKRISSSEALRHEYFSSQHSPVMCRPEDLPKIEKDSHEFQSRLNKQKLQQQSQNAAQQAAKPQQMVGKPYNNGTAVNIFQTSSGSQHPPYNTLPNNNAHPNHNPNYYNKTSKVHENKIKIEETHIKEPVAKEPVKETFHTNIFSTSSALQSLVGVKRQGDTNLENSQPVKKPRHEDLDSSANECKFSSDEK